MKLLTGVLVVAFLGVTMSADAWPWSRKRTPPRLPKAIDSPVVRPKQNAEKATRQRHPSKYLKQEWGQEWDRTLAIKQPKEGNHSIFRD